ncbi:MAG: SUF system NifU family Fe-S cluster assembly protein [Candidatus Diapherotrites archaeon]|uniref:SUF system NifU family Fe-S cluster assembly protein n=1 Tax=Candidatus Iainarchaeum sp. TaxID=3101447 RepID=A0A8T3YM89_9ARCH|nr:SUF system NifU family Fe-S cluster assembly protein [Candidatus Diapherotrites archaeon]
MGSSIYTEIILELYKNPLNKGRIEGADIEASGGNPTCGDQVTFTLKVKSGIIEDIKFHGSGCAISVAAESLLGEMVKGRKIQEAKKITDKELFAELGNIIQTRGKCALLGLMVLKIGLEEYEKNSEKRTVVKGIVV